MHGVRERDSDNGNVVNLKFCEIFQKQIKEDRKIISIKCPDLLDILESQHFRSPKQEYCEFQGNLSYRPKKNLSQKTKIKLIRSC